MPRLPLKITGLIWDREEVTATGGIQELGGGRLRVCTKLEYSSHLQDHILFATTQQDQQELF